MGEVAIREKIARLTQHLPRCSGVYVIRNILNGKVYVGSSKNVRYRANKHFADLNKSRHHNDHLQNAWNLYGDEVFVVLLVCRCDVQLLLDLEREWIIRLNACADASGYNLVADPVRHTLSADTRKKMSNASPRKGKPAYNRGVPASDETRRLISESGKGRVKSTSERAKLSTAMLGQSHPFRGKRMHASGLANMRRARHTQGPQSGKYKGVNFDARTQTYMARVLVGGKQKFLGRYKSEDDAARAYNNEAVLHWGEDCYLNQVSPGVPVRCREIGRRLIHAS